MSFFLTLVFIGFPISIGLGIFLANGVLVILLHLDKFCTVTNYLSF